MLPAVVVVIVLAHGAQSALALTEHQFSTTFGSAGSAAGQLENPQGVAVDQGTGEVYVADTGNDRVDKFDAAGNFVLAFGASIGGPGVNTCTTSCVSGTAGTAPGQFTTPTFVAVDNDPSSPSYEDVYVADTGDNLVQKFDSSGNLISGWGDSSAHGTAPDGQLDGSSASGGPFIGIGGIATDGSGDLFVLDPNTDNLFEFGQGGAADATVPVSAAYGLGPVGLGVDVLGNLLMGISVPGVERVSDAGIELGLISPSYDGDTGFAVDPATNDLYVDRAAGTTIGHYQFDSSGNVVELSGSPCGVVAGQNGCPVATDSFGSGSLTGGSGIAVDGASKTVYVADAAANRVVIFSPFAVTTSLVSSVTPTAVTLNGSVNPYGSTITGCHFEYGTDTTYSLGSLPCMDSGGNSVVGDAGSSPIAMHADLSDLTAGVTYHFRLVAANSGGSFDGVDGVFGPVLLDGQSTSNMGQTTATLNAQVNPAGVDTSCRFEYVDHAHYDPSATDPYAAGQSIPCSPADLGTGATDQAASATLTALQPGVTYHWRTVVTSAEGTVDGPDQTFQSVPAAQIDSVTITNVSSIGGSVGATLTAQIDPLGNDTTCAFEWGTTTDYGHSIPCSPSDLGAGSSDVGVSQQLSGLSDDQPYHFRVLASNSVGTIYSGDHTFAYNRTGDKLPDGRGYEQVTPVQKNVATIERGAFINQPSVAADGDAVIAHSISCFAGSQGCTADRLLEGQPYLFARGSAGWGTTPLAPPAAAVSGASDMSASADAGAALFSAGTPPAGEDDWYVSRADGAVSDVGPVYPPADGANGVEPVVSVSPSGDFSHLYFELDSAAWPSSGNGLSAYEYVGTGNSRPALVGVSGTAGSTDLISACATELGPVSTDGGMAFFMADRCASGTGANATTPVPANEAWVRIDGSRSVELSVRSPADCTTQACVGSPPEDASFPRAADDDSKAFFTSTQQLTDEGTQGSSNLYEYDFSSPAGHELTDVSAGDTSGQGPGASDPLAVSADGSHAYFVASGVLSTAANSGGNYAEPGAYNLYVYERDPNYPGGHLAFIAALSGPDLTASDPVHRGVTASPANVTPDGRFLVFTSHNDLTADDGSRTGAAQVFRYDAQTARLTRLSIGAGGVNDNGNAGSASVCAGQAYLASLGCTADAGIQVPGGSSGPRRDPSMSDDGHRVFFQSPVGLTPQAQNLTQIGTTDYAAPVYAQNVYEWEEAGIGSCPAASSHGCVYLISDGKDVGLGQGGGVSDVLLIGSDATGDNVFFLTSDELVPQDTDTEADVYDARVGGGFPYTPASQCTGDACQGSQSQPPPPSVATITFGGPGNPASGAAPYGQVKILTRVVRGTSSVVIVKTPGAGLITLSGAGIKTVRKRVSAAGEHRLRVTLTSQSKRTLTRRQVLELRIRAAYASASGAGSAASALLTVKTPFRAHRARRADTRHRAGLR